MNIAAAMNFMQSWNADILNDIFNLSYLKNILFLLLRPGNFVILYLIILSNFKSMLKNNWIQSYSLNSKISPI